jgi:asparaginyl-tRNA synthetase
VSYYLEQGDKLIGKEIEITGRLTRFTTQSKIIFGALSDGSCPEELQFIYEIKADVEQPTGITELIERVKTGSSVTLFGRIVKAPPKAKQVIELYIKDVKVISIVREPDTYPYGLSAMKKRSKEDWTEYLKSIRSDIHRRFRHKIMSSIMRIRGASKSALFEFFTSLGFVSSDSPILTKSDCEGAGEMFTVTGFKLDDIAHKDDGTIDYSKDFFGSEAHLSVSGQLEAESLAQVLGKVFTFGPTFRAEDSHTPRHLAEFWMLEPELVFPQYDIEHRFQSLMDLEESMVKCVIGYLFEKCLDDLKFLDSTCSPMLIEKLSKILDESFARVTYTECIDILSKKVADGYQFEDSKIFWGMDLASEHEKYLCEKEFKKPTFVTHYPQDLKSFYMKADLGCALDRQTVQAVDLLIPGIGELCGGSMREDDPDKLVEVMKKKGVPTKDLQWYIDLRYDGGLPTGGFGLGFERLVTFVTGAPSVRDTIAFPRYPKHLE